MERAVEWALAAFRDAGIDDVHTEKFTIPHSWSEGATRVEIVSPSGFAVHAVSGTWSPATPPSGIEADVIDAGSGTAEDFARAGSAARGAILLVHTNVLRTFSDISAEYLRNPEIIRRSIAAGASAILWMGAREGMLLYRQRVGLGQDGSIEKLPQAIVAREDAQRMAGQLAAGQRIRVRAGIAESCGRPGGSAERSGGNSRQREAQ